jgi:hypothetical protein
LHETHRREAFPGGMFSIEDPFRDGCQAVRQARGKRRSVKA